MWKMEGITHLEKTDSLGYQKGSEPVHVSSYLSRELILPLLESLSNIENILDKKCEDQHQRGTFSKHGRQLLKINMLSPLSRLHGMHASCILKDYHRYNYWYVSTLLLKSYFLFFLHICYILGLFSTSLFCMQNFIIFQTHLEHLQTYYQTRQNISWYIIVVLELVPCQLWA